MNSKGLSSESGPLSTIDSQAEVSQSRLFQHLHWDSQFVSPRYMIPAATPGSATGSPRCWTMLGSPPNKEAQRNEMPKPPQLLDVPGPFLRLQHCAQPPSKKLIVLLSGSLPGAPDHMWGGVCLEHKSTGKSRALPSGSAFPSPQWTDRTCTLMLCPKLPVPVLSHL